MSKRTGARTFCLACVVAVLLFSGLPPSTWAEACGDIDPAVYGVGSNDLAWVLADFGCDGGDCPGDVDGDGDTDQADLAWMMIYWHCPDDIECGPCEPQGTGTIDVGFVAVDNTSVGPGDDPQHPDFNGGVTHFTFDIVVTISADNDWTTQSSSVEILADEVKFFQHDFAGDYEPPSGQVDAFPAMRYDTFFASPPAIFDIYIPGIAVNPEWEDQVVYTVWFDTPRDDDFTTTTQRITLIVPEDSGIVPAVRTDDCAHEFPILATISTDATSASTGADFLHREFTIIDIAHPLCPGDVDGDGDIDQSDLGALLASYELPPNDPFHDPRADLNCDGLVDQADLGELLAHYGAACK